MIKQILTSAAMIVGTTAAVHVMLEEFDMAVNGDQGLLDGCRKAWKALELRCATERMNDWEKANLIEELYNRQSRTIIANESKTYRNVKARAFNTACYLEARIKF